MQVNTTEIVIETVVPQIKLGEIQISADRRSTKEKPLTDAERIRRAVLPATAWGELAATLNAERSQSLTDILRESLKQLASNRLRDELEENPLQRTIKLENYSVQALLAWSSETAASRGSITFTRDQATNWFAKSATAAAMLAKHGAKGIAVVQMLTNRYGALAARNHGLKDASEATKLISIIDPADLEGESAALTTELISRLESIVKALTAKANEATVSMDDI